MNAVAVALLVLICAAPAAAQEEPVLITLERTACYGTCPVYTVSMSSDGEVKYSGSGHVRVSGSRTWKIDPAAVRAMADEMRKAGFFEMKDAYEMMVTDLPTTYTTLAIGARTKKIKDYFGAPAALKEIEARIDRVSGARGYVRVDAAAIREMRAKGWQPTGGDAARWMDGALYEGDAETVKALLDAGMSARAADEHGVTLAMKAAESGDPETVRVVLAAGGDPTARDRAGRNAADRARDGMSQKPRGVATVHATGRPRDYAAILRLLTDE